MNDSVWIDYTNHRNERGWRRIKPMRIWFGETQGHSAQWLLTAIDERRNEARDFALRFVHHWHPARDGDHDNPPQVIQLVDGVKVVVES